MKIKLLLKMIVAGAFIFGLSSCLPAHLQKYRNRAAASGPGADMPSPGPSGSAGQQAMPARGISGKTARSRPSIYPIDSQTYRFHLRGDDVWDSALSILLKNYNLTIVDRESGIITTEWDTFYLDQVVYRNKLSLRVRRAGWNTVDVSILNNVERLQNGASAGAIGAVWLPAEDTANEASRVIQNMALILNQAPPSLPQSAIATGTTTKSGS